MTAAPAPARSGSGSTATPPTPSKFRDLRLRTLSSLVLIAAVIGLLYMGNLWLLAAHVLVVFPLMIWETVSLIRRWWPDRRLGQRVAMVTAVTAVLGSYMASTAWLLSHELTWASYLGALILIILNDIGCYAGGRFIGGRKLAPNISPGKTLSGSFCGIATVLLVVYLPALLLAFSFNKPMTTPPTAPLIILVALMLTLFSLLAQAGDLLESYFKRLCNAKDSSHLIPGHGGVLDRFDSQFLTMPVTAIFIMNSISAIGLVGG